MLMKKSYLRFSIFLLLIFSIITGCSSQSDDSQAEGSAQGSEVSRGGEAVVSYHVDISSYDPILGATDADQVLLWPVYDTLIKFSPDLELEPGLAESWETIDDQTIVLHLRDGVTFHDGTPFNAEAVKFNLERSNSDEAKISELKNIKSVEVVDDLTVKLHLNEPDATILAALTDRGGMMVSPTAVQEYGDDFAQNPVGAGQFKFVQHVPNGEIVLEAFEDYWDEGKPYLDKLTIKIMGEENTQVNALKSGEIDFAYGLSQANVSTLENDPNLVVREDTSLRFEVISLNKLETPFDDPNVRRAISLGIDRQALIDAINFGKGEPAYQPYPSDYWASDPEIEIPYDPDEAKKLLKEAGVENLSFSIIHRPDPIFSRLVEAVAAQLSEIGIEVKLKPMEIGAADATFFSDQKENAYFTVYTGRVDPQQAVELLFAGESFYNVGGVPHEKLDALITEAKQTYDLEERKKIYQEISRIAVIEEAIQIPIMFTPRVAAMKENLKGFEPNLLGKPLFVEFWIEE